MFAVKCRIDHLLFFFGEIFLRQAMNYFAEFISHEQLVLAL